MAVNVMYALLECFSKTPYLYVCFGSCNHVDFYIWYFHYDTVLHQHEIIGIMQLFYPTEANLTTYHL